MAGENSKLVCYLMSVHDNPQGMLRTLQSIFDDESLGDILIIDDGSRIPLSLPIMPPDFSVQVIRKELNRGLVEALNTGLGWILAASYRYIARIDAGDIVHKGRLRAQIDYMQAHPLTAVLGTQMDAIDPTTGKTLFPMRNPTDPLPVKKMLRVRNVLAHPSVMIRADAIRQCGLYDARYACAEDYELWRRLARQCDVANLPDIYVSKEITPRQITARLRRRSILSRLHAQLVYFEPFYIHSWYGLIRSLGSFFISRRALLAMRQWRAA